MHKMKIDFKSIRIMLLIKKLSMYYFFKRNIKSNSLSFIASIFGFVASQGQSFEIPQSNPFNLPSNLNNGTLTSADLDNDGDLDLIIATMYSSYGTSDNTQLKYFKNVGSADAPLFVAGADNFVPTPSFSQYYAVYARAVELSDLDNDGDYDILMSQEAWEYGNPNNHTWYFIENIGNVSSPNFANPIENPFNLDLAANFSFFDLVDIDNDGDLDLFRQDIAQYNTISFQENIGTSQNPNFAALQLNSFGISPTSNLNILNLGDIDEDGDFDLLSTDDNGNFHVFENIGNESSPSFDQPQMNPFDLSSQGIYIIPHLLDLDSDGDLDILTGTYTSSGNSSVLFYKNNLITDLEENFSSEFVQIFPNPTSELINVSFFAQNEEFTLELFDLNGKLLVIEEGFGNTEVDIRNYSQGIYSLVLTTSNNLQNIKIVKN